MTAHDDASRTLLGRLKSALTVAVVSTIYGALLGSAIVSVILALVSLG